MSSNDGQKLLVFGLTFAQHDNRKMQQVLRHYDRMPSNPGNRPALFVELHKLARQLVADEASQEQAHQLTKWMKEGGNFPLGEVPAPVNAATVHQGGYPGQFGQQTGPQRHLAFPPHQAARQQYQVQPRINNRGPGRTLDGNVVDEDNQYNHNLPSAYENWHDHDNDDAFLPDGDALDEDDPEQAASEADERQGDPEVHDEPMDDSWSEDDGGDTDGWGNGTPQHPGGGAFRGRGRTLNDPEEPTSATEDNDEPARAGPANRPDGGPRNGVPQLRRDRAWRGDNVVGVRNVGANMMADIMDQHMHGLPAGLPGGEDDDFDQEVGFGGGRYFGFGPGRTLDDPAPIPDEGEGQDAAANNPFNINHANGFNNVDPESDPDSDDDDDEIHGAEPPAAAGEPDEEDAEEIECPICVGEYPPSSFPKRATITESCDHPDKACLQCLDASIAAVVERGALHLVACPICPQKLTRRDVKEYASREVYERYKYLKQQSEIPGHWISCTNPACGGSQPHDLHKAEGPRMVCNHCQFVTCAKHRRPWHEGQTCTEFDCDPAQLERLEEEEATAQLLAQESTSICPKCGQGVTKTDGCDHMMCQCGTAWCYVVSDLLSSLSPSSRFAFVGWP